MFNLIIICSLKIYIKKIHDLWQSKAHKSSSIKKFNIYLKHSHKTKNYAGFSSCSNEAPPMFHALKNS